MHYKLKFVVSVDRLAFVGFDSLPNGAPPHPRINVEENCAKQNGLARASPPQHWMGGVGGAPNVW